MRAGYYGSIQVSDPSEVMLRAIHRIRQRTDATLETEKRKESPEPGLLTRSIQAGRAVSRCRCVVKMSGRHSITRERIIAAATLNLAIAEGLEWALHLRRESKGTREVVEIHMARLRMGGKSDTLAGQPCYAWTSGGPSIEQEVDRILADILTLKLREIDELVDRLVAGGSIAQLEELEEALRKVRMPKRPTPVAQP